MKNCLVILLLLISFNCISQQRCHTTEYEENLKNKYSQYKEERKKVNKETNHWIENNYNNKNSIITIPVVVHIVWNTTQENISDQQIFSQIDVLNADFRRTNIDAIMTPTVWTSIAADTEIEFCLATIDPNGAFTSGITRTQTSQTSFSIQADAMKSTSTGGIDPWDQDNYLNIWVCDLSGGILGYATPPSSFNNPDDGVVIGYNYFGTLGTVQAPYNKGRTSTHEVGHWLNLDHIWGSGGNCGNDNVNDTPIQEEENYNCPAFPHNANSCGTSNSSGDMFMNYMDYTNDGCMNLFTLGQKARMIAAINQYRTNLLNNNLCNTNPPIPSWNCINGNCIDPQNGNGTYSDINNCIVSCFCAAGSPPLSEDFQTGLPGWTIINNDGSDTWELTNISGYNSSSSIYINNAEYSANGEIDDLVLPTLDLTSFSSIYLTFDYAYSLWTNPSSAQNWSDTLKIYISQDCGNTWQLIWEKAGLDLVTTSPVYNSFSWNPTSNNDWGSEVIDLSIYSNEDDFSIKFRNINQFENNLFIDNINLWDNNTSINDNFSKDKKLLKIIDVLGRNRSKFSPSIYLYIYDDNTVEKKVIIKD
ncbi:MAG: zinc metalloprotease [Flavobacteriales bacterium]|jgi:hypothetical protein|nr:zinc metalloprotease [Flavobacteriales bacterium]